jgi:hypothetical protein
MVVEATGHCVKDSYGSGEPCTYIDDFTCFWPGKPGREISPTLYDVERAEEEFWSATERGINQ